MAGGAKAVAPIIIKKKKVIAGGGHHGGAWKVAYADFVTAMMAFFLLMWLLNATTEDQRKGLADYFNPSIPISKVSGGGNGALEGSSVFESRDLSRDKAGASDEFPNAQERPVEGGEEPIEGPADKAGTGIDANAGANKLEEIQDAIDSQSVNAMEDTLAKHIQTRMTPDGLVIELVDMDGKSLYNIGSAEPSQLMHDLLSVIGPVLGTVSNEMAIVGHTDSRAFSNSADYSNWELSTDRAHTARRMLIKSGIPSGQIVQVTGKADTEPFADDPLAAENRRIAITLLNPN
ncbi:flagellar motor protein MotB [Hyphococcus sp. DH-69]|uniref:flagellar motor protein MotB n=1 Tax=Hyphococcus formosus TaxID=3143534 RepID=UPI00398B92FA